MSATVPGEVDKHRENVAELQETLSYTTQEEEQSNHLNMANSKQ